MMSMLSDGYYARSGYDSNLYTFRVQYWETNGQPKAGMTSPTYNPQLAIDRYAPTPQIVVPENYSIDQALRLNDLSTHVMAFSKMSSVDNPGIISAEIMSFQMRFESATSPGIFTLLPIDIPDPTSFANAFANAPFGLAFKFTAGISTSTCTVYSYKADGTIDMLSTILTPFTVNAGEWHLIYIVIDSASSWQVFIDFGKPTFIKSTMMSPIFTIPSLGIAGLCFDTKGCSVTIDNINNNWGAAPSGSRHLSV